MGNQGLPRHRYRFLIRGAIHATTGFAPIEVRALEADVRRTILHEIAHISSPQEIEHRGTKLFIEGLRPDYGPTGSYPGPEVGFWEAALRDCACHGLPGSKRLGKSRLHIGVVLRTLARSPIRLLGVLAFVSCEPRHKLVARAAGPVYLSTSGVSRQSIELEKRLPEFVWEMGLTHAYAMFEGYLAEILRARLRLHPRLMGAQREVKYEQIFVAESKQSLIEGMSNAK